MYKYNGELCKYKSSAIISHYNAITQKKKIISTKNIWKSNDNTVLNKLLTSIENSHTHQKNNNNANYELMNKLFTLTNTTINILSTHTFRTYQNSSVTMVLE